MLKMKECSIDACEEKRFGKGFCHKHYNRWLRHGDPLCVINGSMETPKRFWSKVDKKDGCWRWKGELTRGYGNICVGGKKIGHRIGILGKSTTGRYQINCVLHKCFNSFCVNPNHLRLGTDFVDANDWDRIGDRHGMAVVPDYVVGDVIRRYKVPGISQQALAERSDWIRLACKSGDRGPVGSRGNQVDNLAV